MNDVPGSTSKDTFVQHPEKLQTEIVVRDERNQIAYHYRVQDTPGEFAQTYSQRVGFLTAPGSLTSSGSSACT